MLLPDVSGDDTPSESLVTTEPPGAFCILRGRHVTLGLEPGAWAAGVDRMLTEGACVTQPRAMSLETADGRGDTYHCCCPRS